MNTLHAAGRVREPAQAIDRRDQDVAHAAVLQFGQHAQPELGAILLADPQARQLLLAGQVDAQGQVHRPGLDLALGPELQVDGVQADHRPDRIQGPALPGLDLIEGRVCDLRDQGRGDLNVVQLLQVRLHLAGGHAPGVQGQNLLVEAGQPDLTLADGLGLELAVAIAGSVDIEFAVAVDDPLGCLAVAGVTGAVALRRVLAVAEVIGHLGVRARSIRRFLRS